MSSKWQRAAARDRRTADIKELIETCGYDCKWFTPYHVRVWVFDKVFDFFPTSGKYHEQDTTFWGQYDSLEQLFKIVNSDNITA